MPSADTGFDRVAPFYDPLARLVFGDALQRAQQAALAGLPPGRPRVLIIGGGSGWVLGEVLQRRPDARVLYLEASAMMLAKSRATLLQTAPQHAGQVEFRLGTERDLRPDESFDVILTFFFLDLFEPSRLQAILGALNRVRRPGAPWLLADFRPAQTLWQRLLLRAMYRFFRLTTGISGRDMPDLHPELRNLGLQLQQQQLFFRGMVEASVFN
ncbi:class I SAM-dependent methyltransferase [Hymenobacter cellulosivorans]|uniref:Class I SAM-dependent methyltransferase n=1 Tax=Hymenobacter cellulosivorans TaxID=2932249 RepID=A0ABY4FFC2_9BACT|nr:class I SAM-dependent methyltransferase [Hymenobacter cellulosivorans]UOQ55371.1 class I SAM-dependent methyltransferase [Hymenobacter cellulosivorans]